MAKLETLAAEQAVVRPPEAVQRRVSWQDYEAAYRRSVGDSVGDNAAFGADVARALGWTRLRRTVRESGGVRHRCFLGNETHTTSAPKRLDAGRADKTACIRLGEDGSQKRLTYRNHRQVHRATNALEAWA